jgi:hypothetical protein
MYVEQTVAPMGIFGPFFGMEAYDDSAGTQPSLIASLGVDAVTGELLIQQAATGALIAPGPVVNFRQWNRFHVQLDFQTETYLYALNQVTFGPAGFVDGGGTPGGLVGFTDATISAIAAAGDPDSAALTGTAYFDNFMVADGPCLPEPETELWAFVAGSLATRRRGLKI